VSAIAAKKKRPTASCCQSATRMVRLGGHVQSGTRRVAQKIRQAGRVVSQEMVRRWRANGGGLWIASSIRSTPRGQRLDEAIPVLTRDPLTTAESFVGASKTAEALSSLRCRTGHESQLAIAVIVVADAVTRHADTALTRPIEVGTLLGSLACAQAVSAGFVQAETMQAAEPKSADR
jgi:hypothetical protein